MSHVEHSILKETRLYLEKTAGDLFLLKKKVHCFSSLKRSSESEGGDYSVLDKEGIKCMASVKNKMMEYLFCPHQNPLATKIYSKPVNALPFSQANQRTFACRRHLNKC